jgi:microcystin-dependent protein
MSDDDFDITDYLDGHDLSTDTSTDTDSPTDDTDGHDGHTDDGHEDGHGDDDYSDLYEEIEIPEGVTTSNGVSLKALERDGKGYNPYLSIVHGFDGFTNLCNCDGSGSSGGTGSNGGSDGSSSSGDFYVSISGDEIITGAKSFNNTTTFNDSAVFNGTTTFYGNTEAKAVTLTDTTPSTGNSVVCKDWVESNYATIDSVTGKFVDLTTSQTIKGNKTFYHWANFQNGINISGSSMYVDTTSYTELRCSGDINLLSEEIWINPDGHNYNNGGQDGDRHATVLSFRSNGAAVFNMCEPILQEGGGIYFNSSDWWGKKDFENVSDSNYDDGHSVFLNKYGLRLEKFNEPYNDSYAVNATYVKNHFVDLTNNQTIGGIKSVSTPTVSTQIANKQYVDDSIPAGTVVWYAGTTCPDGWIECNGTLLRRTTYSRLFAAIGTTYGEGDGSTTFKIPDLITDGRFIRSRTSSVPVGTYQNDMFIYMFGSVSGVRSSTQLSSAPTSGLLRWTSTVKTIASGTTSSSTYGYGLTFDSSSATGYASGKGGTEERPKNVSMMAIIKY